MVVQLVRGAVLVLAGLRVDVAACRVDLPRWGSVEPRLRSSNRGSGEIRTRQRRHGRAGIVWHGIPGSAGLEPQRHLADEVEPVLV